MWKYGISEDVAREIVHASSCDICGKPQRAGKAMCVDHCHTTGKVRGALCDMCNKGLGQFHDSVELLKKAAQYLVERS